MLILSIDRVCVGGVHIDSCSWGFIHAVKKRRPADGNDGTIKKWWIRSITEPEIGRHGI